MTKKLSKCRICGKAFFKQPILEYRNMPAVAQHLPDSGNLYEDKGIDLNVCQCSACGLVQLDSEAVPYYREVIRTAAFSEEMRGFRKKQFAEWVSENELHNKKVLELGCGGGEYLELLADSGVEAYGLEFSEKLVEECRDKNLKVQKGYLGDNSCHLTEAPFDAFIVLNWLEHLPELNNVLAKIYNSLNKNAIGLVEVPNFDMILRTNAFSEFIADHLYYFTVKTLTTTLEMNGFEVYSCKEVWHDYVISAQIRKRGALTLPEFKLTQAKLVVQLNDFVDQYTKDDIAIWGASHQALTVISLASLQSKVKCVIDSAPFKQNKFTPATHLPIFAPDVLKNTSIKAIIIMASSYSDEVVRTIRKHYNQNMKLAVLRENRLEEL